MTVRLRDAHFTTIGRSVSLPQTSTELGELRGAAWTALRAATEAMGLDTDEESGAGARLLGMSVGALSTTAQLALLPGEAAPISAADSPSGQAEVAVRFEVAGSHTARQRRFTVGDPQLTAVTPAPVQPVVGPALSLP